MSLRTLVRYMEKNGKMVATGLMLFVVVTVVTPRSLTNYKRHKKREQRMKELTDDERIAVEYINAKLKEERWRAHFKAINRIPGDQ
mmetsp:Transcript_42547/g.52384  ORF Transcript_42547/g.52384 Transcript_42547/m.52384 type:complete len:86 (+) Transcript_42547:46-303(+)